MNTEAGKWITLVAALASIGLAYLTVGLVIGADIILNLLLRIGVDGMLILLMISVTNLLLRYGRSMILLVGRVFCVRSLEFGYIGPDLPSPLPLARSVKCAVGSYWRGAGRRGREPLVIRLRADFRSDCFSSIGIALHLVHFSRAFSCYGGWSAANDVYGFVYFTDTLTTLSGWIRNE